MDHQDHSSHHSRVRIYRDNRAFSNMYHSMNSPFEEVPVGYTQVVVAAGNSPVVVVPVGNNLVVVEDLVDSSPVEGLVGYNIGSFKIENLLLIVTKCVTKRQTATQ